MDALWVWVWIGLAAFAPVLAGMCVGSLPALMERTARLPGQLLDRVVPGRRSGRIRADHRSLDLLAADLRRLSGQLRRQAGSQEFLRVRRMQATALAYDDVLREACETLEVEVPDHRPLEDLERLETEAALAQRGLVW